MASSGRTSRAVSDAVYTLIAGGALCFTCIAILYDVLIRAMGWQPPIWTSAATEYAMLVMTMAIAPWLVRHKANVSVDLLARRLSQRGQEVLRVVTNLLAAALCLLVVAVALRLGLDAHARGEMDIRAIEIPRWTLFALLGAGFGLCGLEFLRHALSREAAAQDRTSPLTGEA